jgi:hypothetical protein
MSLLRGQLHNIVESLQDGDSAIQLVHRPLLLIEVSTNCENDLKNDLKDGTENGTENETENELKNEKKYKHKHTPVNANPLCSCW